jgi:hypothetical protein
VPRRRRASRSIPFENGDAQLWRDAVASGVHELTNQSGVVAGAKYGPGAVEGTGGAAVGTARDLMQSAAKPGRGMLKSGAYEAGIEDMLTKGYNATVGGYKSAMGVITDINNRIGEVIRNSKARISPTEVAERGGEVLVKYAGDATNDYKGASWASSEATPTIQHTIDTFMANPLFTLDERTAGGKLAAEIQKHKALVAQRDASGVELGRPGGPVTATNSFDIPGMPRTAEPISPLGGPGEAFPVPGMPRVSERVSGAPDAPAPHSGPTQTELHGQISESTARIAELQQQLAHAANNGIPIQLAQELKKSLYKDIGNSGYGPGVKPEPVRDTMKGLARGLKEDIADAEPSVGVLNREESSMINMVSTFEAAALRDANKNPLGLITLARHPSLIPVWMADRSPLFKSIAARMLYKVGTTMQTTGKGAAVAAPLGIEGGEAELNTIKPPLQLPPGQLRLPPGVPQQENLRNLSTLTLPAPGN